MSEKKRTQSTTTTTTAAPQTIVVVHRLIIRSFPHLLPEELPVDRPRRDVLERVAVQPRDSRGVLFRAGAQDGRRRHRRRANEEEAKKERGEEKINLWREGEGRLALLLFFFFSLSLRNKKSDGRT